MDHPNWFKVVPHTLQGQEDLAKLWVQTLVEVYGMDSHWRFTVAPLSIDFIRAWRNEMMPSRAISTFKLFNTRGYSQPEVRQIRAKRVAEKQQAEQIASEVSVLLTRAKKLGLAGTDLIRLAQCEGSKEVIKAITALVYAGQGAAGIAIAKADVDELELYRTLEFDEFEGGFVGYKDLSGAGILTGVKELCFMKYSFSAHSRTMRSSAIIFLRHACSKGVLRTQTFNVSLPFR